MTSSCIFVVEDDPWYADLLEYQIKLDPGYTVEKFHTGKECLNNLYKNPLLITLDFSLPDMKGKEVLKRIRESKPDLPVIIISGQEDIRTAIDLLREGAYDYIIKDEDTRNRLINSLRHIRENSRLKSENEQLKEMVGKKYSVSTLILGKSEAVRNIYSEISLAADSSITVSLTGETGTGKELVAKAIHYNSSRRKNPFVVINVAAIPSELIESELFGHEKGAFTGAITRRIGKFEEADKGTIFLDEIAEMDLNMQVKLLRVLQEREFNRIGSNVPVKTDIRVITATHKDLAVEVNQGRFRADLFYRLMGLPIHLPPLRERGKDILLLAEHFANEFCRENEKPKVTFSPEAKTKLLNYTYPGNIRELKSVVELAVLLADKEVIKPESINFRMIDEKKDLLGREMSLEDYTGGIIRHYLEKYDHKAILVAEKLQVAKSTLYRLMRKYDL